MAKTMENSNGKWQWQRQMATANGNGKWQRQMATANGNGKGQRQMATAKGTGKCQRQRQRAMAMATANVSSRQQTMKEVEGSMLDGWQGFGVVRRAVSTCSWCRYPRYYTYSPFPNPVVDIVREGLSLPIACRYLG